MTPASWTDRYGELALLKLSCSGEKGDTVNAIHRALQGFVGTRASKESQLDCIKEALEPLIANGECVAKGARRTLTKKARQNAQANFGIRSGPVTWPTVQKADVIVRALELPEPNVSQRKSLMTATGLRAVIIRRHYDLKMTAYPTLANVREALAWKSFSRMTGEEDRFGGRKKFGTGPILSYVLASLLKSEELTEPSPKILATLAQSAVDADKPDASELRRRIIGEWIFEHSRPGSLDFADEVLRAAESCSSGRFGNDKVFISHVFKELQRQGSLHAASRDGFERRLLDAYNAHRLSLSRADLVEAMPERDVAESEVRSGTAQFHFIRTRV